MGAQRDRRRGDRRVDQERSLATMSSRNRSASRSGKCTRSRTMLRTGLNGRPPRHHRGFGVMVASLWYPTTRPPHGSACSRIPVEARCLVSVVAGRTAVTSGGGEQR
jgi:hypothetical protein